MILRLEIPWLNKEICKELEKHPHALGIVSYLDGERLYNIRSFRPLDNCTMRKINEYTFEFDGEFELREAHEANTIPGTIDIWQV